MQLLKKFLFSSVLLVNAAAYAQHEGVTISDKMEPPFANAVVDIKTPPSPNGKGIIIPRMTKIEMEAINPKTEALMVYVIGDPTAPTPKERIKDEGFWFWDAVLSQWLKVDAGSVGFQDLLAPRGSIIMYCGTFVNFDSTGKGKPGTEMEGWAICNGKNETPDLRAKFVVGAKLNDPEYGAVGNTQEAGGKMRSMGANEMPKHKHIPQSNLITAIVPPHTHQVVDKPHIHAFTTDNGWDGGYPAKGGAEDQGGFAMNPNSTGIWIDGSGPHPVDLKIDENFLLEEGKTKSYDNRPSYYVVSFIMLTDDDYKASLPHATK